MNEYDVFLSYRHQEPVMTWTRNRLVPGLRACGVRVCIDHVDFDPGVPVTLEMARAVESSTYTVAIMTPAYLAGSFTQLEAVMAQHLGLEEALWRLVPVMRERVRPPLNLRTLLWLDMAEDGGFDEALRQLCDHLRKAPRGGTWG
jgi:hypothetical protein